MICITYLTVLDIVTDSRKIDKGYIVKTMTELPETASSGRNAVGRPAVAVLSTERIAEAALEMIDGGRDFSMRSLARSLEVSTPSLYYHVQNKNELANLIRNLLISRQSIPPSPIEDWVEEVRALVTTIWEAYSSHPRLVVLLMDSPLSSTAATAIYDRIAKALRKAGLDDYSAAIALEVLDGFALGNGLGHVRSADSWGDTEPGSALHDVIGAWNQRPGAMKVAFEVGLNALLNQIRSGGMFSGVVPGGDTIAGK